MVSSLELADIVGDAVGIARESAQLHLKTIRAAGEISFKGFGRSAAAMTPMDASRLLIATAGSYFAKDSARVLKRFGKLRPVGRRIRRPFGTLEECVALRIEEHPIVARERELRNPRSSPQKFASPRLADMALQLLDPLPLPKHDKTDDLPRFAIVRWLDNNGEADVAVFGSDGVVLERGTDVPDLLDLYSEHPFFQVRIVRRQALVDIAKALKGASPSTR
jgi:hypothetical protein